MKINHISAPQADTLIFRSQRLPTVLNGKIKNTGLAMFQKMQSIAICGDDERRELWIIAERGSIEDFDDYEEYLAEGDVVAV